MTRRLRRRGTKASRVPTRLVSWPAIGMATAAVLVLVGIAVRSRHSNPSNPEVAGWAAHVNLNQLEPAVRQLVESQLKKVAARPDDSAELGELGLILEANRLWSEARAAYAEAVKLDPNNRHWRFHLAVATYESGDFVSSTTMLETLAQDHPQSLPIQQRLGHALLENDRLNEAESAFAKMVNLAPKRPEGYVGLADVCLRRGEFEKTETLLSQALALDPSYRVIHFMLGTTYQRLGRTAEAERELAGGEGANLRYLADDLGARLESYAVNRDSRLNRAVQLMSSGHHAEAARLLEMALKSDEKNVTILNNLAGAYVQTGRHEQAKELLLRALRLDDGKYTTYVNLASWNLHFGQPPNALKFAEEAVRRAPWISSTQRIRLQVLLKMKRFDEARSAILAARDQAPRDTYIEQVAAKLLTSPSSSSKQSIRP